MDRPSLPQPVRLALDELKQALEQIHGPRLRGVYLYGSYARGDFHEGSGVFFGQHLVKTGELPAEMHRWLLDAFDKRQVGDYTPDASLDEQAIGDLQPRAEEFVRRIEALLRQIGSR